MKVAVKGMEYAGKRKVDTVIREECAFTGRNTGKIRYKNEGEREK